MQLKLILPNNTKPKPPVWMEKAEMDVAKKWMNILEIEWWETRGRGYLSTGIVTVNSKEKDALMADTHNPKKDIILVRETEPIELVKG